MALPRLHAKDVHLALRRFYIQDGRTGVELALRMMS